MHMIRFGKYVFFLIRDLSSFGLDIQYILYGDTSQDLTVCIILALDEFFVFFFNSHHCQ